MNAKSFKEAGTNFSFSDWMKNSTNLWNQISPEGVGNFESMMGKENILNNQGKEWWNSAFKSWEKAAPDFLNTNSTDFFSMDGNKHVNDFSDTIQKNWKNFLNIQQNLFKNIQDNNEKEQQDKSKTGNKILDTWNSLYNNEISKFFSVPQLGLNREYQEKTANLCDKLNRFQIKTSEYMNLLLVPVKSAAEDMQKEFMESAKKGELPKSNEDFYNKWIKKLEENYNKIYRSPEYIKIMGSTIFAMTEFISVRNDLLQNMMKSLPIPSKSDVDDLYKDLYKLKKRVQAIEKAAKIKK